MSNRLKIIIFSLALFLLIPIVLIQVAPAAESEVLLLSVAQAKNEVVNCEELIISASENNDLLVDSVNTKFFRARVGTTWEYSGYSKEMGEYDIEREEDVKREKVYRKLTVLKIEKSGDDYKLEVSNSETAKNENWLVNDDYFSDSTSYIEFPLHYAKRWLYQGEDDNSDWAKMTKKRSDSFYQNRVEEVLKNKVLGNDCYVVGYNTAADRSYSIFCDNIGIVEEFYKHNGTISEYRDHLVKYRY